MNTQLPDHCRLADHVRACRTTDYVVLLDLKRDKYIGIDAKVATGLSSILFPSHASRDPDTEVTDAISGPGSKGTPESEVLETMLFHGMLLPADGSAASAPGLQIDRPQTALFDGYFEFDTRISAADVFKFLVAVLLASTKIRFQSLYRTISRLEAVSRRNSNQSEAMDLILARKRVAVFQRLSPFLLTNRNACLLQSLALYEFLNLYKLRPRWVFGVATDPFIAHCWIQHGSTILNDVPEHVLKFTPIMAV